jgi:hypothetical protein
MTEKVDRTRFQSSATPPAAAAAAAAAMAIPFPLAARPPFSLLKGGTAVTVALDAEDAGLAGVGVAVVLCR